MFSWQNKFWEIETIQYSPWITVAILFARFHSASTVYCELWFPPYAFFSPLFSRRLAEWFGVDPSHWCCVTSVERKFLSLITRFSQGAQPVGRQDGLLVGGFCVITALDYSRCQGRYRRSRLSCWASFIRVDFNFPIAPLYSNLVWTPGLLFRKLLLLKTTGQTVVIWILDGGDNCKPGGESAAAGLQVIGIPIVTVAGGGRSHANDLGAVATRRDLFNSVPLFSFYSNRLTPLFGASVSLLDHYPFCRQF